MDLDPTQIIARLEGDNPPTDAELEKASLDIREALDEATQADEPDLSLAKTLRGALDALTGEAAKRIDAREARKAEAAKLREGIFDTESTDETPEGDTDAPEGDTTEGEAPVVEAEDKKEPVAASVADIVASLRSKAVATKKKQETRVLPGVIAKPMGAAVGFNIGNGTWGDLGQMFATHAKSISGVGKSDRLFTLTKEFAPERVLGASVDQNAKRMAEVFGFGDTTRPVTAAGGLCGPGDVDHSHPICADRGRPVRDSLTQFNASRGQVTYNPSAGLGDVDGAVSIWTAEIDANPGSATKPCPPVVCPEELTATVDAITRCLTIGNFQAKFSPELWASRLELLAALHDRVAEQKSIEEIHEGSTGVTALVDGGNVIANFLSNVNSIIASDRAIQRKLNGQYVVLADEWVRDQMRNQVIANMGAVNTPESVQLADSLIARWLSEAGARAVWTPDGTVNDATGDHNIPAGVGALPASTTVYVYPEDAWFFLDGGTIDLGTSITDSSLNATNDRQAFMETFEKTAFRGCSSYFFSLATDLFCGCSPQG